MDVLKVLGVVAIVLAAFIVYYAIEAHCEERFGAKPISRASFLAAGAAAWAVHLGYRWRLDLIAKQGDALNGTVVIGLGVALGLAIVVRNVVKLRPVFGVLATLLQVGLLPLAMLVVPLYPVWRVVRWWGVTPVRIVND